MRLAELSERSGVPTATVKYYLREGLLPAGRRVSATQAEYDEGHLRRLRLVRAQVATLLTELGWSTTLELGELSPVHRSLVASVATLVRLGYPCDIGYLSRLARIMEQAAVHDLDEMETYPSEAEQVEKAVASAVLDEPLLMSLRRLAQSEESACRYGL
ncbi:MerR family transcriptional regulator [Streptomyces cyaneofuscatus]|uniref:MerR family transcriptional regulator n=1 Tax=Streptomyces cyaneofuscatus TaxID=66883 RepID=UPI0037D149CA